MTGEELQASLNVVFGLLNVGALIALLKMRTEIRKTKAETSKTVQDAYKVEVDVRQRYADLYGKEVKENIEQKNYYMERYLAAEKENTELRDKHKHTESACEEKIESLQKQIDELVEWKSRVAMRFPEINDKLL